VPDLRIQLSNIKPNKDRNCEGGGERRGKENYSSHSKLRNVTLNFKFNFFIHVKVMLVSK
jgi:hypothetical protein